MTRSTSSKLCALASPRLRRSSPGSWLLFQLYSILWVSICVDTSTPGWSSLPLRSLSSRFFYLSSDFVQFLGLSSIPGIPTSYLPRWCSVCGSSSIPPLSGLLRRWNASLGGNLNRRIYVMRLAYREPVAVASRRSFFASSPSSGRLAFFLSWLASFLAATWDCSPSSSASIVHGTVRIWRLQS